MNALAVPDRRSRPHSSESPSMSSSMYGFPSSFKTSTSKYWKPQLAICGLTWANAPGGA